MDNTGIINAGNIVFEKKERAGYMKLEIKENCLIVYLQGELDSHYADKMRKTVDETAEKYGVKNIIIDMENVTFMDSSGIGFSVGRYKYTTRRGGITAAAKAQNSVKRIMLLSGLHRIIAIYDSLEEAVSKIERR